MTVVVVDVVDDGDRRPPRCAGGPATVTAPRAPAEPAYPRAGRAPAERRRRRHGRGRPTSHRSTASGLARTTPQRWRPTDAGPRPGHDRRDLAGRAVHAAGPGADRRRRRHHPVVRHSAYFVAFDGDQVAIFQAGPAACCWIEPELVDATGLDRDRRARRRHGDIEPGIEQASLANAPLRRQRDRAGRQADRAPVDHQHRRRRPPHRTTTPPTDAPRSPPPPPHHRARTARAGHPRHGRCLPAGPSEDGKIPANVRAFLGIVLGLQLAAHSPSAASPGRRQHAPADRRAAQRARLRHHLRLDKAGANRKAWPGCNRHGWSSAMPSSPRSSWSAGCELERYRWTIGLLGLGLLLLPLRRSSGALSTAPDLGEHRADQLPAGSSPRSRSPSSSPLPGGEARAARGEPPAPRSRSRTPSTSARCSWPGACRS